MPLRQRQKLSYGGVSISADRDPTSEASFLNELSTLRQFMGGVPLRC
jgi:hypothetical protein